MIEPNKIYCEPCLDTMSKMEPESVDCVITSPPYWQLRNYGYDGQWGLEPTFQEYLEHLWQMMDGVYRILKPTGTAWVNLGDTYGGNNSRASNNGRAGYGNPREGIFERGVSKCLMLIPHRFAIGCFARHLKCSCCGYTARENHWFGRDVDNRKLCPECMKSKYTIERDGWIARNDCIWAKRNGMPESVTDRFSKKHEYFFLFAKQEKYYFDLDAIKDKAISADSSKRNRDETKLNNTPGRTKMGGLKENNFSTRNPGSVSDFWDIPTKPSSEKHYAMYNDELLRKPILAGCPEFVCNKCGKPKLPIGFSKDFSANKKKLRGFLNKIEGLVDCGCNAGFSSGIIYDPFMGAGSTAEAALRANRRFIGSEMGKENVDICNKRTESLLKQGNFFK